ncbi:biopolymer transporter ExbD [Methylotenera sp.]|uniref:ExbD/TolR family protein n=1 Tax=Methylotenera sp. TaxID=2051956 RepID=UPI0027233CF0|nr:biopolymer transporter ExbD [Methylotenera sp.]MDO9204969.1 biopolymer transporter ExbD [Methylotenera sp.]MDO9393680.1 biopolymer transporter ExbD [Methylotenera sp.]MDP1523518.1 biopolymer transporter ExbD [Methylotenera sp.]MDP2071157.1 biopolymer transporter ExbD [Methylotenera sp.]MDP2230082.1 biopolymer transporter ExbD [Methylotenera sp.]
MSFGSFNSQQQHSVKAEINVVPLVDVMLVLLVIFIITAPLLTHSVKIDLPKASSNPNITKPEHVEIAIREDGSLFWNGELVPKASLPARFAIEAKKDPQPELHIRADKLTHYENVAVVMSEAAKTGLVKIGFVTDPTLSQ